MTQTPTPDRLPVHPIVALTSMHIVEENGKLVLSDKALLALTKELKALQTSQVKTAVQSLVDLAMHLENDRGASEVSGRILNLCLTALPTLQSQFLANAEAATARAERACNKMLGGIAPRWSAPSPAITAAAPRTTAASLQLQMPRRIMG